VDGQKCRKWRQRTKLQQQKHAFSIQKRIIVTWKLQYFVEKYFPAFTECSWRGMDAYRFGIYSINRGLRIPQAALTNSARVLLTSVTVCSYSIIARNTFSVTFYRLYIWFGFHLASCRVVHPLALPVLSKYNWIVWIHQWVLLLLIDWHPYSWLWYQLFTKEFAFVVSTQLIGHRGGGGVTCLKSTSRHLTGNQLTQVKLEMAATVFFNLVLLHWLFLYIAAIVCSNGKTSSL